MTRQHHQAQTTSPDPVVSSPTVSARSNTRTRLARTVRAPVRLWARARNAAAVFMADPEPRPTSTVGLPMHLHHSRSWMAVQ